MVRSLGSVEKREPKLHVLARTTITRTGESGGIAPSGGQEIIGPEAGLPGACHVSVLADDGCLRRFGWWCDRCARPFHVSGPLLLDQRLVELTVADFDGGDDHEMFVG